MPRDNNNATLIERVDHNEALATFKIKYNDHEVPEFKPGQYATIGLPEPEPADGKAPKLIRRMYSVASPATQRDALSFYVVRVDEGALTPLLWNLDLGDTMFMAPRLGGHFTIDPVPEGHHVVMFGTGTGLAPFRSMYLTFRGQKRWNKFVMIEGCRLAEDLGYFDEFTGFAKEDPGLVYLPTVTREPEDSDWAGVRGRVTALLEPGVFEEHCGFELKPETCSVFLCGNPAMIDQVEEVLVGRGFAVHSRKNPQGTLHFERYW